MYHQTTPAPVTTITPHNTPITAATTTTTTATTAAVKKKVSGGPSVLGKMWQDIVLAFIGEQFDQPDVVGVSVCIRKAEDLISVWNTDNRNPDIRFCIGERMKEILDLEPSTVIEYKAHAESMQDLSTFRNTKAYVFAAASGSGPGPATGASASAATTAP